MVLWVAYVNQGWIFLLRKAEGETEEPKMIENRKKAKVKTEIMQNSSPRPSSISNISMECNDSNLRILTAIRQNYASN